MISSVLKIGFVLLSKNPKSFFNILSQDTYTFKSEWSFYLADGKVLNGNEEKLEFTNKKVKDKDIMTMVMNKGVVSLFLNQKYLGDAFKSEEFGISDNLIAPCVHLDTNDQVTVLKGYYGPEIKF